MRTNSTIPSSLTDHHYVIQNSGIRCYIRDLNGRRTLRYFPTVCAVSVLFYTPATAGNQLYTGDPSTVPVGSLQFQLFQDSTPNRSYRFAGTSFTYGMSANVDVRAAYGRLWSNVGPDLKIGPNAGVKWRFVGDGWVKPSMAVSALASTTNVAGGARAKTDYGALLLVSYPSRYATLLGNFGRVWIAEQRPDLYYLSFAAVRSVSRRALVALEYSDLRRIGHAVDQGVDTQYAVGIVYAPDKKLSYSLQSGYLPNNARTHWRTTLGLSVLF